MKKKMKKSIFLTTIFIISAMTPLLSTAIAEEPETSQAGTNSFIYGWGNVLTNWDPAIATASELTQMIRHTQEMMIWTDHSGAARPFLATSWQTHGRLDEVSSGGPNTGGIKAITYNLRQGVTFQDGSEWNATVLKWNIERNQYISGYVDPQWKAFHWFNPSTQAARFTPSWNLSWYQYDLFGLGDFIPVINKTEIISNYVVNITLNTWAEPVNSVAMNTRVISMQAYYPWTNITMIGWGQNPAFPQDDPATYPGHMIGTGPYIFEFADPTVTQTLKANKNYEYWNRTALEADGLFSPTEFYIRMFADAGARTNALLAGEIDSCGHILQVPISDLPAVIADPLLNFYPTIFDPSIDCMTYLNTEGLDAPIVGGTYDGQTPREVFPDNFATVIGQPNGTELPGGVNRTVRRALSYAYDYVAYTTEAYATGVGIITTTPYGMGSIWRNDAITAPYYDLTIAREILLSDPYYAAQCAARGLGLANDTDTWKAVGLGGNPIQTYSMLRSETSYKEPFMREALASLGFGLTVRVVEFVWQDWVATGKAVMFDMFTYIWINDVVDPIYYMSLLYKSTSRRIPNFLYNYAHLTNDSIDGWLTNIPFSGAGKQAMYDEMADSLLNYHAPWLYCGQYQFGLAVNSGWEVTTESQQFPGPTGMGVFAAWIGGSRETVSPPSAPEAPEDMTVVIVVVVSISVAALVVIAYVYMKKRK